MEAERKKKAKSYKIIFKHNFLHCYTEGYLAEAAVAAATTTTTKNKIE